LVCGGASTLVVVFEPLNVCLIEGPESDFEESTGLRPVIAHAVNGPNGDPYLLAHLRQPGVIVDCDFDRHIKYLPELGPAPMALQAQSVAGLNRDDLHGRR
jgi:hypothetical protein